MNFKPILIAHGEPNSVFLEIFFKSIKFKKFKSPLILVCSQKIIKFQMKKLKFNNDINIINPISIDKIKLNNKKINIIDIKYNRDVKFNKITSKSNDYIKNCFETSIEIINSGITNKFINGPVSKKSFLKKNFLGITEYLTKMTNVNQSAMLIYNKKLSVCPITTHLPLKLVAKNTTKKKNWRKNIFN